MSQYTARSGHTEWVDHLLDLSGVIAIACVMFIWLNSDPVGESIPEVIVPLGISLGLGGYTHHLKQQPSVSNQAQSMAKYGWAGTVLSGAIGGFWLALHVSFGLPTDVLPDKILTVVSLCVAGGVLVGRSLTLGQQCAPATNRNRVVAETNWAERSGSTPVMTAIIEVMSEGRQVDPLDLDPLYTYIDPEILSRLQSRTDVPCQFSFYTDEYEIRVSSHGTVTVYRLDPEEEPAPDVTSS